MNSDVLLSQITYFYFVMFFIICIPLQSLLFFVIYKKTPKFLANMKYFFYPANFSNLVLTVLSSLSQIRLISNERSLAILCQGPVKFLGAIWCFHSCAILTSNGTVTGLINMQTLFYKMLVIRGVRNAMFRAQLMSLFYVCTIAMISLPYIPPMDFEKVYNDTIVTHPSYSYEEYRDFGGFADSHDIYGTLATSLGCALAILAPAFGFYCRRQCLKVLKQNAMSLSSQTRKQFKSVVIAVGFQIAVPLIVYIPNALFFLYNKYTDEESVFSEFTFQLVGSFTAIFDPLIMFGFVTPYRNAVKQWLSCGKAAQRSRVVTAAESTRSVEGMVNVMK